MVKLRSQRRLILYLACKCKRMRKLSFAKVVGYRQGGHGRNSGFGRTVIRDGFIKVEAGNCVLPHPIHTGQVVSILLIAGKMSQTALATQLYNYHLCQRGRAAVYGECAACCSSCGLYRHRTLQNPEAGLVTAVVIIDQATIHICLESVTNQNQDEPRQDAPRWCSHLRRLVSRVTSVSARRPSRCALQRSLARPRSCLSLS
jgi:hypothetical protein